MAKLRCLNRSLNNHYYVALYCIVGTDLLMANRVVYHDSVEMYFVLQKDPFPGDAPIPADKIQKYRRGDKMVMVGHRVGVNSVFAIQFQFQFR